MISKLHALHGYLNDKIKHRYPKLSYYFYTKPRNRFVKFKNERKLERGVEISSSNKQSILYFTAHKCASSFLQSKLRLLALDAGMIPIDFDSYFSSINRKKYQQFNDDNFLNQAFINTGYYYEAFRSYRDIPKMESYNVILILRDPRDVLTSSYFSAAYSHSVISENTLKKRKVALQKSIDEYVIERSQYFKEIYADYVNKLLNQDQKLLFLKYEDMIKDFDNWFKSLTNHVELGDNKKLVQEIIDSTSFEVKKEDKYSNKRQVKSGDHKNKLKPETIDKLNKIFEDELKTFGYEI